jgi:hypothetical protein
LNLNPTVGAGRMSSVVGSGLCPLCRERNYWEEPPAIEEIFIRFVPDDAFNRSLTGGGCLLPFILITKCLQEAGLELSRSSGYTKGCSSGQ